MRKELKRRKKEQARNLIIQGATIQEASKLSKLSIDVIKKMSAKEGLQQKQLDYLKALQNEMQESVLANKLERLELNKMALQSVRKDITDDKVDKTTFEKIKLSEEIEQKVLEVDRIEKLEKLEILKIQKIKKVTLPPAYFDDMDEELDEEEI